VSEVVLDASAALAVVLRQARGTALLETLSQATRVVAPRLFLSETANALWKYVSAGQLPEATALDRLGEATALVVHPLPDESLVPEALTMAVRYKHPVYDSMYAVLARRLSCPVVTLDQRLRKLLSEARIDVI